MDRQTLAACSSSSRQTVQDGSDSLQYVQSDLMYSQFFLKHLIQNRPCVFSRTFTQNWSCRTNWITQEGTPDFQFLLKSFGDAQVPVADCNVREYNSNPKHLLTLREFVEYWREQQQDDSSPPKHCLYLKDWHMTRMFPDHHGYTTPIYFSSDWLNEFWDTLQVDDYRFVYMGPKGTWTPFHADVFRSYSWSANVCGRKKWLLYPPGHEDLLRDTQGHLPYDITSPDLQDKLRYPRRIEVGPPLEIIQEAGEIVFVPTGWFHQVHNLEDTISINHNWVNGCNVAMMWRFLQGELCSVQREIQEWRDTMESWHQHCQVMMKSCTGIDYAEFASFLRTIAQNRISFLSFGGSSSEALKALGPPHAVFDLLQVDEVLGSMLQDEDFQRVQGSELGFKVEELLQEIRAAIGKFNSGSD